VGWYISVTSHIQIGLIPLDSSSIKHFIQHASTVFSFNISQSRVLDVWEAFSIVSRASHTHVLGYESVNISAWPHVLDPFPLFRCTWRCVSRYLPFGDDSSISRRCSQRKLSVSAASCAYYASSTTSFGENIRQGNAERGQERCAE